MISFENHQIQFSKLNNDTVQMTFDSSSKTVQTNFRNFKSGDTTACFTQFQTSLPQQKTGFIKKAKYFQGPFDVSIFKGPRGSASQKNIKNLGLDLIKKALLPSLV